MFNLERVEVARGPQGTLNGRNSIAGSISYYTTRPTEEWDLLFHTEYTDQFTQRYGVAFGGPITENVLFRLNGSYYQGDGAQKNIGFGDDYDAPDQKFLAPQLRFKTDRMDLNLRYSRLNDDGVPRTQVLLTNFDTSSPHISPGRLDMSGGDWNPSGFWDCRAVTRGQTALAGHSPITCCLTSCMSVSLGSPA